MRSMKACAGGRLGAALGACIDSKGYIRIYIYIILHIVHRSCPYNVVYILRRPYIHNVVHIVRRPYVYNVVYIVRRQYMDNVL